MTNIELLELDRLPEHLVVLGGGYVGLEFAQANLSFGSRVTVVEHGPQLLGREDPDVTEEIRRLLTAEGIEVLLGADVIQVEGRSGEGVRLHVRTAGGRTRPLRAATSWLRRGAPPTPAGSGSTWPASRLTRGATSRSATGWKRPRRTSGRSENAPAARSSRTCPWTRLQGPPRQSGRGKPQHARSARPLLPVHGPAAGPRRPERGGSPPAGGSRCVLRTYR